MGTCMVRMPSHQIHAYILYTFRNVIYLCSRYVHRHIYISEFQQKVTDCTNIVSIYLFEQCTHPLFLFLTCLI